MLRTLTRLMKESTPVLLRQLHAWMAGSILCEAAATVILLPLMIALSSGDKVAWWLLLALVVAVVGTWVCTHRAQTIATDASLLLLQSIHNAMAKRVPRLNPRWLTARKDSVVHSLSGIGPEVGSSVGYLYIPGITAFALPPVVGVALLIGGILAGWGPWLGIVSLIGSIAVAAAWWGSIRVGRTADSRAHAATTEVGERAIELAEYQQALRTCGRSGSTGMMADAVRNEAHALARLILMQIPAQVFFSLAAQLVLIGILAVAGWQWWQGVIPAAGFIALMVVAVRLLQPITQLADLNASVARLTTILDDAITLLHAHTTKPSKPVNTAPSVSVDQCDFSYDDAPALTGITLRVPAGQHVAIVGSSGCGKTTLLKLIAGFERPSRGTVSIDGLPAAPGCASVVFQFPYLFDMTIAENIAGGSEKLSADAREAVAFADDLPKGLDTNCGETGASLSGGQRQRVSIARALAHPSRLLLVDEATSALDPENEATIGRLLTAPGRTTIITSHRPHILRLVDRVVVMEGGRIVADGTYDELHDHPYIRSLNEVAQAEIPGV